MNLDIAAKIRISEHHSQYTLRITKINLKYLSKIVLVIFTSRKPCYAHFYKPPKKLAWMHDVKKGSKKWNISYVIGQLFN